MSKQPSSHPEARSLIVFLLSVISLKSLLTQFTDIQDKVRNLPRRGRGRWSRTDLPSLLNRLRHRLWKITIKCWEFEWPVERAHVKSDFKIRALSCWFIKTTLLPPANKGSLSFLSLQNICCKLLHHSPSLLLTAVIQGRHKMKLPSPCGARIWKPFSTFSMVMSHTWLKQR